VACVVASAAATAAETVSFRAAKPVWPKDRQTEMNLTVGFRAIVAAPTEPAAKVTLRVAASTIYRAWLGERFLGYGPARGPHGFYRVDEWDLTGKLAPGENVVALEVVGYNVNSYYLLDQPSFCQAEVLVGDRVAAATAARDSAFTASVLGERVQKVQRYSFQRPFIEVYRLAPQFDQWRRDPAAKPTAVALAEQPTVSLLPRRAPYPEFAKIAPVAVLGGGTVARQPQVANLWKDRSLVNIGPALKGYPEKDLELVVSTELQHYASKPAAATEKGSPAGPNQSATIPLAAGQYRLLDFGANLAGFVGGRVECRTATRLVVAFDEILTGGDVDFKRLGCVNAVTYLLQPGTYALESIEPYTLRYCKLICLEGDCTVSAPYVREYAHPTTPQAKFVASDERLNRLYAAGVLTFRENTLDAFMDCPSRERAGWLCDSFFTARVAADLTGTTAVEKTFVENFLLPPRFAHLPEGMLPMCYPADHNDGVYIPNWSLWFVVELEEYLARSGDRATVEALRGRVTKLLEFFRKYENSDGLLEKLPSWVFVEWSKANDFVQDVNYPSNMLYAGALSAVGRMYRMPEATAKAEKLRETIRKQSFDGKFFVDNALRRDGKLEVTRNRTEVCQYFAFFFGVADRQRHAELWRVLRDEFGPDRQKKKLHGDVYPANSFIGNMLRVELLSDAGRGQQILDESVAYLLYMAERTGTLWENVGAEASCDHGFASHIVHTLYRDVLGLRRVDAVQRQVLVRFQDVRLPRCEGVLPTPDGPVRLSWTSQGDTLRYSLTLPAGYRATIENQSGRKLVAQ
jgi:alpha-L-rhamnosidase